MYYPTIEERQTTSAKLTSMSTDEIVSLYDKLEVAFNSGHSDDEPDTEFTGRIWDIPMCLNQLLKERRKS